MAWLSGWSYRKEITITGQSGAGTDFQVDFDIGDSAGGDFHLEGHCTNFPQDIEVTDNDGTTLLKFWIADIAADPLELTVKVADDLGTNQTIYIYYGKSGATTNSSGANTFIQYHGAASANFVDALVIPYSSYIYQGKIRVTSDTHDGHWGIGTVSDASDDCAELTSYSPGNARYLQMRNEGAASSISETPKLVTNQWYAGKIIFDGTTAKGYYDDNEISTGGVTSNLPNEDMGLNMHMHTGTCAQEWSFVRKYNSPEPAFSSAGNEETSPTGVTIPVLMHHYNQLMRA